MKSYPVSANTSHLRLENAYGKGLGKAQHPFAQALMFAVIAGVATCHLLYYAPRTIDDMYIFLRYAERLTQGHGLTYNPGEHVEGFSSPVWLLFLTISHYVGIHPITWAKLLSIGAFGFLLGGIYRFGTQELQLSRNYAALACISCVFNSYLVAWASWGLETPVYLALMIWFAVWLARILRSDSAPSRSETAWLSLVGILFILSRPEAPLFALGIVLAQSPTLLKTHNGRGILHRVLPAGMITSAVFVGYVIFRKIYFGLWLPHTHYAKPSEAIRGNNLLPLVAQGASPVETLCVLGGACIALWLAYRKRQFTPVAIGLAALIFAVLVPVDWMPNLRHLLPFWLMLPLVWCWLAQTFADHPKAILKTLRHVPAGILIVVALYQSHIDARYSVFDFQSHGRGEQWIRSKSLTVWKDTWACLNRQTPVHIQHMDNFNHGMITQLYRLFEADTRRLEDTWYVGRDIGRVGWLAPVRVFDTDGLFTPDVVQSPTWKKNRGVDETLLRHAFTKPVVMTEITGPWERAAANSPWLKERYASLHAPHLWMYLFPKNQVHPHANQILSRYKKALQKMPQGYYVMTLYGEAVGAAIERRFDFLKHRL